MSCPDRTVLAGVAPGVYGALTTILVDKSIVKEIVSGSAVANATYGKVVSEHGKVNARPTTLM
ncbi:hypothetical protein P4K49_27075 [Bacillus cereus]|uniref:hypothetical protein n=1 Tax=Bacillus thuringiensis TaxID=1428 RepID=UPI000676CE19|nr:hypothetical protein [Bacillus thuringiensis]MEB8879371.1 hypothetical protein [Bacillus cereus]AKR38914.1 Hypothetical protein NF53_p5161 [Bacillus thuringiensis serovar indiana]MEB9619358.1 hypothetical protein [Bacillus cereus]MEB9640624.1 hypothetical protein [Bacillus cereus]MEB9643989.1 hypothetical protein [Bacillus cereus]